MGDNIPLQDKKPSIGELLRTGSCTGEPQTNALNCLKSRDLTIFSDIVNGTDENTFPLPDNHWINQPLAEEADKTLLMVAIDSGLHSFVTVLLQAGASARLTNQEVDKAPIHSAAQAGDLRALRELFNHDGNQADVNSLMQRSGRSALHICAEKGFESCLKYLLDQKDVQVDLPDKRQHTPLYLVAKSKASSAKSMATALIESGADYNHKCFGKTVSEHLRENIVGFDATAILRSQQQQTSNDQSRMRRMAEILEKAYLPDAAKTEGLNEFKQLRQNMDSVQLNNYLSGGFTLLQKAAEGDLPDFAEVLLHGDNGVDPNGVTDTVRITPLLFSANCSNGTDARMMQLLAQHGADFTAISSDTKETVLHVVLKRGNGPCLEFLLGKGCSKIRDIINWRDLSGNTALHYGTQRHPQEIVRRLLELGANVGMKNHWDDVPINKILPQTMEDFLDQHCIEAKGDVNHENFEITFDYSFLAPPIEDLPLQNRGDPVVSSIVPIDPECQKLSSSMASDNASAREKVALPETQALWYMAQSKEHRHLLKHPVVTSFLYLKWGRIRNNFNRNLRFYMLFVFVLTWYIFEEFGGFGTRKKSEVNVRKAIPFLHGLFAVFSLAMLVFIIRDWIMDVKDVLKADKIRKTKCRLENGSENDEALSSSKGKLLFFVMLTNWVELIFVAFLCFVLFGASTPSSVDRVLWTALLILTAVLLMREIFQVFVSLKRYLVSPENWLEMSVIILVSVIIFHDHEGINGDALHRHLSAVVIVLSWSELITLVGKHPKLTRYNVYVMMLYKVMGSFFSFLCWYAFFIVAFGLGFYIMLHKVKEDGGLDEEKEAGKEGDEYVFFNSPWLALVKTSTMFVGELEFSDIPINLESPLSPLAYVFFLSFVFLIVVVLMNLLNGLAVSDTGAIQAKAEIVSYISRVDTISYTESILLGDPFNFLSNWPALRWLRSLPSCSFCGQLYRHRGIQKLFHKITGATGILLFYNLLPNKRLTLTPNAQRQECNFLQVELMDEDIISSVKEVILKRNAANQNTEMEEWKKMMEMKIDLLLSKLK